MYTGVFQEIGFDSTWMPTFVWCETVEEAANRINLPHEDYPVRVRATQTVIEELLRISDLYMFEGVRPARTIIEACHKHIFHGEHHAGTTREKLLTDVIIGDDLPPSYTDLWKYEDIFRTFDTRALLTLFEVERWYRLFELIHPFVDGNGRVGGAIAAAASHLLFSEKGYLIGE